MLLIERYTIYPVTRFESELLKACTICLAMRLEEIEGIMEVNQMISVISEVRTRFPNQFDDWLVDIVTIYNNESKVNKRLEGFTEMRMKELTWCISSHVIKIVNYKIESNSLSYLRTTFSFQPIKPF